jgi:hypothetical protein
MHSDTIFQSTPMLGIVQDELASDEKLLWCGKPTPQRAFWAASLIWFFAVPWTAFALFWMWMAAGMASGMASGMGERTVSPGFNVRFLFPLFGLPFVFIGLGLLSTPFWAYRKAVKTVYGITNKRLLIIADTGKSRSVDSYGSDNIGDIKRTERPDKSGDLTFAQRTTKNSEGSQHTANISFIGVPEVRRVEELLRATFKKS